MRKKWTTPRLSPSLFTTAFSEHRNNNTIEYVVVFSVQNTQIKSMEVKDWRLDYLPQKIFQNQDEKLKNWFCSWRKVKARPWFQCKVY